MATNKNSVLSQEELLHALEVGKKAATAAAMLMRDCYRVRLDAKAERAAKKEGNSIDSTFDESFLDIETKTSATDLVTKYDRECENIIIEILTASTSYCIISEEHNPSNPLTYEPTWIIDPIDGTMDFVHGLMDCCVSIGLVVNKQPCLGIVYCPFVGPTANNNNDNSDAIVGELVYGGKAVGGAWFNGKLLRKLEGPVASPTAPDQQCVMSSSIVCFNMPWRQSTEAIEAATRVRRDLLLKYKVRGIRAYGSAVFQQVQVALGRIDGYSEPGGKIWDVAAGAALVEAVGGVVFDLEGSAFDLSKSTMITCGSSAEVATKMAGLCKEYDLANQYWA